MVERVVSATAELSEALRRLIPQLTDNHPPPGPAFLEALLNGDSSVLLIARHPDESGGIVGVGCLGIYRVPTGVRAVIEDVVVDEGSRGLGLGEALIKGLMDEARQLGAHGVSLTSNPRRIAANRLYLRMGFSLRQTNSYYFEFT